VPFTFGNDPANDPAGESVHTSFDVYDSLGTPVTVDVTAVLQSKDSSGSVWQFYADSGDNQGGNIALGNGTLTYDNNGNLTAVTGNTITINRAGTGATPLMNVNLDFSGTSALASDQSQLVMNTQDGVQLGTLTTFSVGADGTITGSFSNGLTRTLGQVAIANFANPEGLDNQGGNMYVSAANSGTPVISAPETLGAGAIRSGALEGSNVDLSAQFINLITASTGFSAASRVISTSDELLTDLLNSQH